jgi:opacity protein-like surface antigen
MHKLATLALALTMMSVPAVATANVSLGLRLGFGMPTGEVETDADLKDGFARQIPIQLDVNYGFTPNLRAGVYLSYGFGSVGDALEGLCDSPGVDCSTSDLRAGVQAFYDFSPKSTWSPWLGLGIGYEWAKLSVSDDAGNDGSLTFSGMEFANVQAGADYRVSPAFTVGPFLSYSMGQYSSASASGDYPDTSLGDKSTHGWFQFGIRGTYGL